MPIPSHLLLAGLLSSALVLGACGTDGDQDDATATSSTSSSTPDTDPADADPADTDPPETDPADTDPAETDPADTNGTDTTAGTGATDRSGWCPNAPEGSSPAVVDEQTGTYAATIRAYLPAAGTVTVDIVQWLIGDAAAEAYRNETGEDGGPPNDYYIVNADTQLRTLPLASDVTIRLVALAEDSSADVSVHTNDDLIALIDAGTGGPFWITIDAGEVTEICEQFVP